mmetsp:Transcript_10711/g.28056  ORF Transcript_10711/g.28056 Transcript_10711/m.28056 type:complete len:242 (+) Transcript_10711:988-1713(+)
MLSRIDGHRWEIRLSCAAHPRTAPEATEAHAEPAAAVPHGTPAHIRAARIRVHGTPADTGDASPQHPCSKGPAVERGRGTHNASRPSRTCRPHGDPRPLVGSIVPQQRTPRLARASRGTTGSPARERPVGGQSTGTTAAARCVGRSVSILSTPIPWGPRCTMRSRTRTRRAAPSKRRPVPVTVVARRFGGGRGRDGRQGLRARRDALERRLTHLFVQTDPWRRPGATEHRQCEFPSAGPRS